MLGLRISAYTVFNGDTVAPWLFLSQARIEQFDGGTVFSGRSIQIPDRYDCADRAAMLSGILDRIIGAISVWKDT
jgi:hypothetical protein